MLLFALCVGLLASAVELQLLRSATMRDGSVSVLFARVR